MKKSGFDDFPMAPKLEHCQHCGCHCGTVQHGLRESPLTGYWCRFHWEDGPRCDVDECNEPRMRKRDGGDGLHCRAHMWDDRITEEDRVWVLKGTHPLSTIQVEAHWGDHITPADNMRATKAMEKSGIKTFDNFRREIR